MDCSNPNQNYVIQFNICLDGKELSNKIYISPNPFYSSFNIYYKADDDLQILVRAFSVIGSIIFEKEVRFNKLTKSISFDELSNFPEGIYFIELIDLKSNNSLYLSKLVKQ